MNYPAQTNFAPSSSSPPDWRKARVDCCRARNIPSGPLSKHTMRRPGSLTTSGSKRRRARPEISWLRRQLSLAPGFSHVNMADWKAQRFNAGMYATPEQVPKGRLKDGPTRYTFSRPFGTQIHPTSFPTLKHRATLALSLRDSGSRYGPGISESHSTEAMPARFPRRLGSWRSFADAAYAAGISAQGWRIRRQMEMGTPQRRKRRSPRPRLCEPQRA